MRGAWHFQEMIRVMILSANLGKKFSACVDADAVSIENDFSRTMLLVLWLLSTKEIRLLVNFWRKVYA